MSDVSLEFCSVSVEGRRHLNKSRESDLGSYLMINKNHFCQVGKRNPESFYKYLVPSDSFPKRSSESGLNKT